MKILLQTKTPLTQTDIIEHLRQLRIHSLAESSHFAVAAIIEINLPHGEFAYVCGVNVEHHQHNRLSMHAEQSAIVSAQSLFGGNIQFSKAWVMGAPDTIQHGSEHPLANNEVKPCGHCRQILMSFATTDTEIYSVTVNGVVGAAEKLIDLLPHAFSERDLAVSTTDESVLQASGASVSSTPEETQPWKLLNVRMRLSNENIRRFGCMIKPHIIDSGYQTSAIQSCIIKCLVDGQSQRYFFGALVQDIAFLTTDAIFASIAQAVTASGRTLQIEEIHLQIKSIHKSILLSNCETSHITRFMPVNGQITMQLHTAEASSEPLLFSVDDLEKKTIELQVDSLLSRDPTVSSTSYCTIM